MAERQDIDALLIGALYGELDGDERARLEAHLASHPQDRSALDGLRSTRDLLKEADLPRSFAVEEPSPAITAMLLQEAARRAPAPASKGGFLAFLAGLLKPFAASPALSAAAALVLVGGAAGLLYSRGKFGASEPTVRGDHVAEVERQQYDKANVAMGSGPATMTPTTPNTVDDYRVGLADEATAGTDTGVRGLDEQESLRKNADVSGIVATGDTLERGKESDNTLVGAKGERAGGGGGGIGSGSSGDLAFQSATQSGTTATAKLDADKAARPGYITIDPKAKDQPTVLAVDGSRFENAAEPTIADGDDDENQAKRETKSPERVAVAAEGRAAGTGAGAVPADIPAPAPPPPPSVTPAKKVAPGGGGGTTAGAGSSPQKPIAGKASTQQVARDQAKAGAKPYDPVKAAQLESWARDQHARMVKLVNAGKCIEAGPIGAEIARKAPEYYQANVANDRAVRACRQYVDRARRAKSAEDAKTKAAAPRANAPDSPYQADMETSR